MHGGSASAGSQNYHVTPNEILLPSPEKKQALEKFTKEEDSSLLNISKDPITGVNQNMCMIIIVSINQKALAKFPY
jgi:hypothetical protein